MARPFTSKIHAAALSAMPGARFSDARGHVVLMPADAWRRKRRQAMIANLLGRLEGAAYGAVSFGLITAAAVCLVASFIYGATLVIGAVM